MKDNVLAPKSLLDILGCRFFIPDYQRGYRWTERQVTDLLDDLLEFAEGERKEGDFYCLQPLVVKERNDDWFEVIDGQQRLTTLFILLKLLPPCKKATRLFELAYQRKTDNVDGAAFLRDIGTKTTIEDGQIDFYHMSLAAKTIREWIPKHLEGVALCHFWQVLLDVRFIWYESVDEDPIKVFTRLNIGKISLTNAELVKALILKRSNFQGEVARAIELRQMEIAHQWDAIEYALQNDEFWMFLNKENFDRPTRIDFLLDLVRQRNSLKLNPETIASLGSDKYTVFRYFYEYVNSSSFDLKFCWETVRELFLIFQEWYEDSECFHYVGFLVDRGTEMDNLLKAWEDSSDKTAFIAKLRELIKRIIRNGPHSKSGPSDWDAYLEFQYDLEGGNKRSCIPILLFHNIQTVIDRGQLQENNDKYRDAAFYRFPFHLYKREKWDVEHIHSNTDNPESDLKTMMEWLLNVYLACDDDTQKMIRESFDAKKDDEISKCFYQVKAKFLSPPDWSPEEKNRIWNYTLLDSSTNRSYGNAIFSAKRRIIIGKENGRLIPVPTFKDGRLDPGQETSASSAFVPPCTRNVFLKYYSSVPGDDNYWTQDNAKDYLASIKKCLEKLD